MWTSVDFMPDPALAGTCMRAVLRGVSVLAEVNLRTILQSEQHLGQNHPNLSLRVRFRPT